MYKKCFKRVLDFCGALLALILLSPLLLGVAVIIKLTSPGGVFYRQTRVGKDRKLFTILKFRSMRIDVQVKPAKYSIVTNADPRITWIGKIIRRTKIDELPQLINVLYGDLSIVGPRPTLEVYLPDYEKWELERFSVKPGLSGLAQINGNIFLNRIEKSYYEIKYIKNVTFLSDVKIVLRTIKIMFCGEENFVNHPSLEEIELVKK